MAQLTSYNFEFNIKTKTKFGIGVSKNLPAFLKELSLKRIGIIVSESAKKNTLVLEILGDIEKSKFEFIKIWVYDIKREPNYETLDKIKLLFIDQNQKPVVDCFVGIGGGSVLDFAKGLATLVVNPGEATKYKGFPKDLKPSLPTIALPTTAGTGSEVTFNASFIDDKVKKKMGINTHNNFPVLSILDPLLITTCPKQVMISAAMDAIGHALDSYINVKANPLTRMFAKEAIKYLFNNIQKAVNNNQDLEAVARIQLGAYLAGITLMNTGAGVAEAMGYPLGVHFKVPHGIAVATFRHHIISFNVNNGYDYSELYDLIENVDKSLGNEQKSKLFSEKYSELTKSVGIPPNLQTFGVNESNIQPMLTDLEGFGGAFSLNPIPYSIEEGKRLYKNLIK